MLDGHHVDTMLVNGLLYGLSPDADTDQSKIPMADTKDSKGMITLLYETMAALDDHSFSLQARA